jgi:hypothetical protein
MLFHLGEQGTEFSFPLEERQSKAYDVITAGRWRLPHNDLRYVRQLAFDPPFADFQHQALSPFSSINSKISLRSSTTASSSVIASLARTSGSGKSAASSRDSSLSQVMSSL